MFTLLCSITQRTVTLPKWLNDVAETAGINFSRSLQTAIRLKLEVSPPPKKPGPEYDLKRRGRRRMVEKM